VGSDGIRPTVQRDTSDTWSHGLVRYDDEELPLAFEGGDVIDDGPLRSTIRLRFRFGDSRLVEDVILESSPPRVELRLRAVWSSARCVVKLVLPWKLNGGVTMSAGAAYSYQDRGATGGEETFQGWLDAFDVWNDVGVAVTTTHLYGYDASGPEVRLTVLRNPLAADHGHTWAQHVGEDYELTDSGSHDVRIEVIPHEGDWRRARLPLRAEELARPFVAIAESYHQGPMAGRGSFLHLEPADFAVVRSVKRSEDESGVVLRLVESKGETVSGTIGGGVLGRSIPVSLEPYEVATVLVPNEPTEPARRVTLAELDFERTEVDD
jgi:alpha-mannosidase